MRRVACVISLLAATFLIGCAATLREQELEVELRQAQAEREEMQTRFEREQARLASLESQAQQFREGRDAERARATALSAELNKAHERYDELVEVFERFKNRRLERPVVRVSPLTPAIDTALAAYAEQLQGRVWYDRPRGAISYAADRLFASGSAEVRSDAYASLQELAAILSEAPEDHEFIVVGHTDDAPITKPETVAQHPTNWHLSVHRAIAVREALTSAGVPAERFAVMGYGSYRPLGEERARNRRVEVFIVPKGAARALAPVRPQ